MEHAPCPARVEGHPRLPGVLLEVRVRRIRPHADLAGRLVPQAGLTDGRGDLLLEAHVDEELQAGQGLSAVQGQRRDVLVPEVAAVAPYHGEPVVHAADARPLARSPVAPGLVVALATRRGA